MTEAFRLHDLVYWMRPPGYGNGYINNIPAKVIGIHGSRVTIEAWGKNGTTRVLSVPAKYIKLREPRETE